MEDHRETGWPQGPTFVRLRPGRRRRRRHRDRACRQIHRRDNLNPTRDIQTASLLNLKVDIGLNK